MFAADSGRVQNAASWNQHSAPPEAVRAYFGYGDTPNFPARFNIAPTQPVAVVWPDRWRPLLARQCPPPRRRR